MRRYEDCIIDMLQGDTPKAKYEYLMYIKKIAQKYCEIRSLIVDECYDERVCLVQDIAKQ